MALDRETLVRTALRLIDEGGLESLTLRKLASELGVQAPALYWHVKNKRELLDLVAERLAGEQQASFGVAPGPDQPWWEWIEQRTLDSRRAMLTHRDSALIAAGNRPTTDALPGAETTMAALTGIGLPPAEALMFLLSTGYYLIGGVLERQLSESRESNDAESEAFEQMRDASRYPLLAAAVAGFAEANGIDPAEATDEATARAMTGAFDDGIFAYGLGLMIEGLRARLERSSSPE